MALFSGCSGCYCSCCSGGHQPQRRMDWTRWQQTTLLPLCRRVYFLLTAGVWCSSRAPAFEAAHRLPCNMAVGCFLPWPLRSFFEGCVRVFIEGLKRPGDTGFLSTTKQTASSIIHYRLLTWSLQLAQSNTASFAIFRSSFEASGLLQESFRKSFRAFSKIALFRSRLRKSLERRV